MKNILQPKTSIMADKGINHSEEIIDIDPDEPELRQEFIDEMLEIEKEKSTPLTSFEDLFGEEQVFSMYFIEIKPQFKKNVRKIKNFEDKKAVFNKMQEIANTLEFNPNHYKNLRKPMQKCKRVHINTILLWFLKWII